MDITYKWITDRLIVASGIALVWAQIEYGFLFSIENPKLQEYIGHFLMWTLLGVCFWMAGSLYTTLVSAWNLYKHWRDRSQN